MTPPLRLFVMGSPLEREGNSFAVLGRLPLTEYAAVVYNPAHKSSARARIPIFATKKSRQGGHAMWTGPTSSDLTMVPPRYVVDTLTNKMKEEVVEKGFKEGVEGSTPDEHILDGLSLRSRTRLPRGGDVYEGIFCT